MKTNTLAGRRGFSLIELLVVVAVIALLISILLPSLSRARLQARAAVCLSQTRQLGIAVTMYTQTSRGLLPDFGLAHGGSVDWDTSWVNSLSREFGRRGTDVAIDPQHLRCPDDKSPYWNQPYGGTDQVRMTSYAVNDYVTGRVTGHEAYQRLDRIRRPATTILFAELAEDTAYAVTDHIHAAIWALNPEEQAREQVAIDRHLGRANYTFADGHAAPHRFEQTYRIASQQRVGPRMVIQWSHNMYDPKVAY